MTEFLENGKIDDQIPNRNTNTRLALFRLKDAKRKVLQWKMRITRDFDEGSERHDW